MNIPSYPLLDILISLVLIFSLLSILVSIINEWLSHYFNDRSKLLKESLLKLLKDDYNLNYAELFLNHFSIRSLMKDKPYKKFLFFTNRSTAPRKVMPHYISSSMFADALIDVIAEQAKHTQSIRLRKDEKGLPLLDENGLKSYEPISEAPPDELIKRFERALQVMNPSPFNNLLKSYYDKSEGKYLPLKASLEAWFNDYMDRVSGWYKNKQRNKLIWVGLFVALMLNVDSLHLVKMLSLDNKLRENLVQEAGGIADNYKRLSDTLRYDIGNQIMLFKKTDSLLQRVKEINELDEKTLTSNPQLFADALRKAYPNKYDTIIQFMLFQDSVSKDLFHKADQVLGTAAALNIPIGYSRESAPLSWFCMPEDNTSFSKSKTRDNGIIAYTVARNKGNGDGHFYLKYLIGIFISAVSLSFGAPFWFSLLIKLVDIRRAGIKPKLNESKKD